MISDYDCERDNEHLQGIAANKHVIFERTVPAALLQRKMMGGWETPCFTTSGYMQRFQVSRGSRENRGPGFSRATGIPRPPPYSGWVVFLRSGGGGLLYAVAQEGGGWYSRGTGGGQLCPWEYC